MTLADEIDALSEALARLLRAWPGGSAPTIQDARELHAPDSQRFKIDAELLIAAPVRHSMVLGIRTIGLRLDVLAGSGGRNDALARALAILPAIDREKLETVVLNVWRTIEMAATPVTATRGLRRKSVANSLGRDTDKAAPNMIRAK